MRNQTADGDEEGEKESSRQVENKPMKRREEETK